MWLKRGGRTISVEVIPQRYKLRKDSDVTVNISNQMEHGTVNKIPKFPRAEIDLDSYIATNTKKIKGIHVRRFKENNFKLEMLSQFTTGFLSSSNITLSPIEAFVYKGNTTSLSTPSISKPSHTITLPNLNHTLNCAQLQAVKSSSGTLSVVEGPPGTGKTEVIAATVLQVMKAGKGVLLISETNNSVRRIYDSIIRAGVAHTRDIDLLVSYDFYQQHKDDYSKKDTWTKDYYKRIVLCTVTKALLFLKKTLKMYRSQSGQFVPRDLLILDEATMTSTLTFYHLLACSKDIPRIMVLGDTKQRRPFSVQNTYTESCMDLILNMKEKTNSPLILKTFLNIQYRMQPDVANLVSKVFYDNKIQNAKPWNKERNLHFQHVNGQVKIKGNSRYARNESIAVLKLISKLRIDHPRANIVVLTFYQAQVEDITLTNSQQRITERFRIKTVDSYQGLEADIIVLCTCAYDSTVPDHIENRFRACVSLSRSKSKLYIVGNRGTLVNSNLWLEILNLIEK